MDDDGPHQLVRYAKMGGEIEVEIIAALRAPDGIEISVPRKR